MGETDPQEARHLPGTGSFTSDLKTVYKIAVIFMDAQGLLPTSKSPWCNTPSQGISLYDSFTSLNVAALAVRWMILREEILSFRAAAVRKAP